MRFAAELAAIDARQTGAAERLDAYAGLYADVLRARRMCLCGMLAAEHETLPDPIRDALIAFFEANERWLAVVLEQGREAGALDFDGSAIEAAGSIVSGLEGAMLVARSYGDPTRFETAAKRLLSGLRTHAAHAT
jgi:TetR/AcrR family transcriptional regulator, transcriptional repressor for nem operon